MRLTVAMFVVAAIAVGPAIAQQSMPNQNIIADRSRPPAWPAGPRYLANRSWSSSQRAELILAPGAGTPLIRYHYPCKPPGGGLSWSTTPDRNRSESAMPAFVWEINFALWIMIGCAAMKVTHLVQYLTN
jgi:hypothetical protein